MAAYLQSRGLASVFGKRFVSQINYASSPNTSSSPFLFRRAVHVSVYDKNPEEHVRGTVVPDDVIQVESDKYWAPHPQTGVFGPATDQNPNVGGDRDFYSSPVSTSGESVLEQKAFFRPLEDLEKPPQP